MISKCNPFTFFAGRLVLVALLGIAAVFGISQPSAGQQTPAPAREEGQTQETPTVQPEGLESPKVYVKHLKIPTWFTTLHDYATRRFAGRYDAGTLEEGLADNQPSVTFSHTVGGRRNIYLLIHRGQLIDLQRTTVKLELPVDAPGDEADHDRVGPADEQVHPMVGSCGGVSSPGNPYPCCNGGNCTFWAWHKAKTVWRQSLPGFSRTSVYPSGDARYWAGHASSNGWPVSPEPGSRTISVSSTISSFGHVWFNEFLGWQELWGNEMHWCTNGARYNVRRTFTQSNKGYIYPKLESWRPQVYLTVAPMLWSGPQNQWIQFSGQNFTHDSIVDVMTPGGQYVSLRGSQLVLSHSGCLWIQAVLNARGWWKFKVVAQDGQRSAYASVWVN